MKALKDIFVTYEIAQKLKEIRFDSECIGYYNKNKEIIIYDFESNERDYFFIAPTYEQVFKWFREKGLYCTIHKIQSEDNTFLFTIDKDKRIYESDICTTYENAIEFLILKLIEIYKKEKKFLKMEKQIFKVGDRVFDIRYGWGVVDEVDRIDSLLSVKVKFDNYKNQFVSYNHKGCRNRLEENPLLSFKEYTLEGFSQEKPVNYNEHIGKWGKFWDNSCEFFIIDKLKKVDYEGKVFLSYWSTCFDNFEPLSEEQIQILNLE